MVNLSQRAGMFCFAAMLTACGPSSAPTDTVPLTEAVAVEQASPLPQTGYALNDAASRLSFVSIKAGDIVETHRFDRMSGGVSAEGQGRLVIDLASVNTAVDIRNERMRELFFETATYPEATITTSIDTGAFEALEIGERVEQTLAASLSLHGIELPMDATVSVTRLDANTVSVDSLAPVPVAAADFDLAEGIETLRALAGLDGITPASLVTFSLVYDAI